MKRPKRKPVYLDYNATTPHDPEVIAAMRPYLEVHFGNPSSSHWYGRVAKEAVETARGQVAALLHCSPDEILFTSGGTESNNNAIKGFAAAYGNKGNHIITTRIEHPAVIEVCRSLESQGFETTYLPVDEDGLVDVAHVEKMITPKTILISVMHSNNEVGTIQPIEDIARLARARGIVMHTDAAQSVGKVQVDVESIGVDMLSIAGHKLYAPKGVGVLYVRNGVQLKRLMHGAGQEGGRRAGTENVLEIVGLGKACEIAARDLGGNMQQMRDMRDMLYAGLKERVMDTRLNGHPDARLPNTLSIGFKTVNAQELLTAIQERVAASCGAACHSGGVRISHVLEAMQVPDEWARGTLRFSTGRMTTVKEIEAAIDVTSEAVLKLIRK